ncbi:hypothetical protein ANAPC5_00916 [Anaplasma phagocytophilum]|nr:hypothetical protein ANAPC5_00916 [Anaplasma phagocytophilum]
MLGDISSETLVQSSMLCRTARKIAFLRLVSSEPREESKHLLKAENSALTYALKTIFALNAAFVSCPCSGLYNIPETAIAKQFTVIPHALAICRCAPLLMKFGSMKRSTSLLHSAVTQL